MRTNSLAVWHSKRTKSWHFWWNLRQVIVNSQGAWFGNSANMVHYLSYIYDTLWDQWWDKYFYSKLVKEKKIRKWNLPWHECMRSSSLWAVRNKTDLLVARILCNSQHLQHLTWFSSVATIVVYLISDYGNMTPHFESSELATRSKLIT